MFNIGDVVGWESQSAGHVKKKEGIVVDVIEPMIYVIGTDAKDYSSAYFKPRHGKYKNPQFKVSRRNHTSYIVECDGKSYWPRVRYLRSASK